MDQSATARVTSGMAPAVMAATGSVFLALYYYYVRGDHARGQFVGLWPPTILAMATYLKLEKHVDEHREHLRQSHEQPPMTHVD